MLNTCCNETLLFSHHLPHFGADLVSQTLIDLGPDVHPLALDLLCDTLGDHLHGHALGEPILAVSIKAIVPLAREVEVILLDKVLLARALQQLATFR